MINNDYLKWIDYYGIEIPGKNYDKLFCIDKDNCYCVIDQLYAIEKGWV